MPAKTLEQFILDAKKIYGNKYTYEEVDYIDSKTKVIVTCDPHGDFPIRPNDLLTGHGCKPCGIEKCAAQKRKTQEQFILDARKVHGNKYRYDKTIYVNSRTSVIIYCYTHGYFNQKADDHTTKEHGCSKCGDIEKSLATRKSLEQFILDAIEVHGNKYDYSKVVYVNSHTKVIIICDTHGEFEQMPGNHLNGDNCPRCSSYKNELTCINIIEKITDEIFEKKKHDFIRNKEGYMLELDGYNEELKLAIEYNGMQHYEYVPYFHRNGIEDLYKQMEHDRIKFQKCEENDIYLIVVPYWIEDKEQFIAHEYDNYLLKELLFID